MSEQNEHQIQDTAAKAEETLASALETAAETSSAQILPKAPLLTLTLFGKSIALKAWHLALTFGLIAILIGGSISLGFMLGREPVDPDLDPDAETYEDIYANIGNGDPENISIPGYSDVAFPANTKNVRMVLLNPEGNPCYFRFSLVLINEETNDEEVIYQSGLIPPGHAVDNLKLDRELQAGIYQMEIRIATLSLEDRAAMNSATIDVELTVQP
jgi:hypothetical protein